MTSPGYLSSFSPNLTAPEDLEAIHVQRHDLLAEAVDLIAESALTENKHHLLFIGPRGTGKTHLVSLIVHRLSQRADLASRLRVAWLNEDESSTTFLDFLLRCYRSLTAEYPDEFAADALDPLFELKPAAALHTLQSLLLEKLGNHTLLIVTENLDTLFSQLDAADLKSWRAYIQDHPVFCTVATAQRLFNGARKQDDPFYGFFDTRHLKPLSADEARELLEAIARHRKDSSLAEFLTTSRGRARIRALHHLVGGNHRLYILLSECINKESLDTLVEAFNETTDKQLTPYYQERLRWLSPLQRKIVEHLCNSALTVPVKAIARALFSSHPTVAKQLQELRKLGYVSNDHRGRESLYQLAEPLMRVAMQVKESRGRRPLEIIVDFLRIWYDREELETRLSTIDTAAASHAYLKSAIDKLDPSLPNLRHELLRTEVGDIDLETCNQEDFETLQTLAEESGQARDLLALALATAYKGQHEEAASLWSRIIDMPDAPAEQIAKALVNRGVTHGRLGRHDDEIADYRRILDMPEAPPEATARSIAQLASLAFSSGEPKTALEWLSNARFEDPSHRARLLPAFTAATRTAWSSGLEAEGFSGPAKDLADALRSADFLDLLSQALVRHLADLHSNKLVGKEALEAWLVAWESALADNPDMKLTLRLLRTGIAYLKSGDEGTLLDLTDAERRILLDTFGLDDDTGE